MHSTTDDSGGAQPARRKGAVVAPGSAVEAATGPVGSADDARPKGGATREKAELPRSFPVMLSPGRTKSAPKKRKGKTKKGKKEKSTIVTFKCTATLLAAVDSCTDSMRVFDPMASRATVIRMALVEFLQPRGFLP